MERDRMVGEAKEGKVTSKAGARTAKDRAKDRAIHAALTKIGDKGAPVIVRVGTKKPAKAMPVRAPDAAPSKKKPKERAKVAEASPSALADALLKAGLKPKPVPQALTSEERLLKKEAKRKKREAKRAKREAEKAAPKPKARKKKASPTPPKAVKSPQMDREAIKKAKRQQRFLERLRKEAATLQAELTAVELRWKERQAEIAALIENIQRASFTKLASEWKKHVSLVGYIEATGTNADRHPTYTGLIAAIEKEWGRRTKLRFDSDEYFDWPSTKAGRGRKGVADINWATEGFLSYLGYHVGESSDLTDHARRAVLRQTFKMVLPPLESPEYVKSWGPPSSPARLKKMAHSLASFARSAKRRSSGNWQTAISHWENDLRMLHDEFYVAKFGFGWPRV